MSDKSKIEWTDATWNPVRGCSVVSEGCRNCYAMAVAARFSGPGMPYEGLAYRNGSGPHWTGKVRLIGEHLEDPLRWKTPRRIFVNSMSDLFHESLSDESIDRVFAVMIRAEHHIYQVLTKRPERMLDYFKNDAMWRVFKLLAKQGYADAVGAPALPVDVWGWVKHIWLGVSVEDQKTADERIPLLLQTPAAVRWISAEPLLGPVDLRFNTYALAGSKWIDENGVANPEHHKQRRDRLDWVVVGGESGPKARPFDLAWGKSIVEQCQAASVPVFVKQLGANPILDCPPGEEAEGQFRDDGSARYWTIGFIKDKKGGDINEWPEDLRVREYPKAKAVSSAA